MTTKEKYTEVIKEVVRNEAVSKDKLVALARKHKANKLKIELFLRQAGVIENMGNGVNRVLIRDKDIEPYVDAVVEMSNTSKKRPPKKKVIKENEPEYQIIAEEEIDLYAKIMDMIEGLDTRISKKTMSLEERIMKLESFVDDIGHTEPIEDPIVTLKKKIAELENNIKEDRNILTLNVRRLNDRIVNLEEKTPIDNNKGMLKALHQLLGELI